MLEVGGGPGELAARIRAELGCDVVMVDVSPRMVELARARGVDAQVGDVQELPFESGSFDCARRGLDALPRARPRPRAGGAGASPATRRPARRGHERERPPARAARDRRTCGLGTGGSRARTGRRILERHFAKVERRDADGWVTITDDETVHAYIASLHHDAAVEPQPYELPLRSRRATSIFVAEKAR